MKVLGTEIPQQLIDEALRWFPPDRSFTFTDFQRVLCHKGVPSGISDRAADRILQKARKAGTHGYRANQWKRVSGAA